MLIPGEQLAKSLADESQRMEVGDAGICEYADLNLDWEVPWRWRGRGNICMINSDREVSQ